VSDCKNPPGEMTDKALAWDKMAEKNAEIARLREMNTQLFEQRQEALRRESRMRLRAEAAETELRQLRMDR